MFGGSARMFPQTPLWLSTGLVRPIKYSKERQLEKNGNGKMANKRCLELNVE